MSFSGILSAQELSNTLAGCDLLLFADGPGPTSRKTTLAASLASGAAVLAADGPASWRQLVESRALALARPEPQALAEEIRELLGDPVSREALGARGRAFAEHSMGLSLSAAVVAGVVRTVLDRGAPDAFSGAGRVPGAQAPGGAAAVLGEGPVAPDGSSARLNSHSARAAP